MMTLTIMTRRYSEEKSVRSGEDCFDTAALRAAFRACCSFQNGDSSSLRNNSAPRSEVINPAKNMPPHPPPSNGGPETSPAAKKKKKEESSPPIPAPPPPIRPETAPRQ